MTSTTKEAPGMEELLGTLEAARNRVSEVGPYWLQKRIELDMARLSALRQQHGAATDQTGNVAPQQSRSVETTAGALLTCPFCGLTPADDEDRDALHYNPGCPAAGRHRQEAWNRRTGAVLYTPPEGTTFEAVSVTTSAPAQQERSDAAGSATLPSLPAAVAHSEELRGLSKRLDEIEEEVSHPSAPPFIGAAYTKVLLKLIRDALALAERAAPQTGWRPTSEAAFSTEYLVRGWGEGKKHYVFGFAKRLKNRSGGELWEDTSVGGGNEELWFAPHEFMPLPKPAAAPPPPETGP